MSAHTIEAILTAKDQGFTSTFDKATQKTESFGQKLKSGLGFGAWMAIGQKAVSSVFGLISSSVGGAVKRFDTLNNFPKVMKSLGFGAKEAEASINKLGSGIEYLPTTLDKVASQTQQVVAVTGDLDEATRLTLALNNAMASGGQSAEQQASAINQWVQAMSKGKPDLQDWRALVQTAPAQMNQLAEATLGAGKTQSDLYEAMKNGSVSIDTVNKKMIELSEKGGKGITSWAKQAESAGGGIQMSMTNVKASVQRNMANIIDATSQMLSKWGGISGIIGSVVPAFDKVGSTITDILTKKISLKQGINTLSNDATNMMLKAMDALGKAMPKIVKVGAEIIMTLTKSIGKNLPKLLNKAGEVMLKFISAVVKVLPKLIVTGLEALTNLASGLNKGRPKLLSQAISIGADLIKGIIKALPAILKAGISLMAELLKGIVSGFGTIPSKVLSLAKGIPSAILKGIGNLANIGSSVITSLGSGISGMASSLGDKAKSTAKKVPEKVKEGIGKLSTVGSNVITSLGEGISSMKTAVGETANGVGSKVRSKVDSGIGSLKKMGSGAIDTLGGGISSMTSWIKDVASGLGGKVPTSIKKGITGLGTIGNNIVKGLWNGAKNMVNWAVAKFKGLGKDILAGIKSALGIKSPSKEFAKVGRWSVLGLVEGLENGQRMVAKATESLVSIPTMGIGGMAVNGAYEYGMTASYTIDVPLYINGREFARATAGDMSTALNTRETRMSRQRGIR